MEMTSQFPRIDPNLRVDQVGSLLRPQKLKDVYTWHGDGKAADDKLRQVQDESIRDLIAKQEAHGLSILTDGEYRRLNFQDSFVESVSGFTPKKQTLQFQVKRTLGGEALQRWQPDSAKTDPALQYWRPISERLRVAENRPLKEWRYAAQLTTKPVKITLIATDRICENFQRQNSSGIYRDADEYLSDVIEIERKIVQQLAQAGCPYVQMDAPSYTAYVDPRSLERMKASGVDPIAQMERSIQADNAVISGIRMLFSEYTYAAATCAACGTARGPMMPSPRDCSTASNMIASCWNTTPSAPADSSRYASCQRIRSWCWDS
jgi:5-methyltetrahydropteroyltriglutamate--homocysteine methyltransferase